MQIVDNALAAVAPVIDEHSVYKSRSPEEEHCIILERSSTVTSKSSNTRYKCLYCDFEFVGGPQKIRVHLTGKRENGTRLSKCERVPEAIKTMMEARMKTPREVANAAGMYEDDEPAAVGLPPRNAEESHCVVICRSSNPQSKSSNSKYKCLYCKFKFIGGPQKIRVHLTGQPEGGTRVAHCPRAPPEVVMLMECRRKGTAVKAESEQADAPPQMGMFPMQMMMPPLGDGVAEDYMHLMPPPAVAQAFFQSMTPEQISSSLASLGALGLMGMTMGMPMNLQAALAAQGMQTLQDMQQGMINLPGMPFPLFNMPTPAPTAESAEPAPSAAASGDVEAAPSSLASEAPCPAPAPQSASSSSPSEVQC